MRTTFNRLWKAIALALVTIQLSCKNSLSTDKKMENKTKEYTLIWEDNFEGDTLNLDHWNRQVEPAGRFNEEWQRYTDDVKNSYVKDGNLIIEAIHESETHESDQYTSARLNTAQKFFFTCGKVVARIKLPKGKGIWPAFWMLGANINENGGDTPWPFTGEIDILELWGTESDAVVEANIHYANEEGKHNMMGAVGYHLKEGSFADKFHEFELEWTPEKMIWRVDGNTFASKDITDKVYDEFRKDFFLLLNIAVGGKNAGRPDTSTVFPQKMYVDWIKVYQLK